MNGGPAPHAPMPAYDAQELRRRVAVCFTIGELSRLAQKLQVPETPAWSNNPQEASRDIVRHFERSGALAFLVEALREAKPLVEWPEPALPPAEPLAGIPPAPPPAPPASPAPADASTHAGASADPGDRPTPIASITEAAVLAGFAPAVMPRPGEVPAAAPAPEPAPEPAPPDSRAAGAAPVPRTVAAEPASDLPPIPDPMMPPSSLGFGNAPSVRGGPPSSAAWPGTVRGGAPAKKPLDPRILLGAGAGLLVTAVAVAFLLGRASSAPDSGSGAAEIPPDQAPIAQHAAEALGASLERVARACKIEVSSLRGRSLFEVAYRRCGPPPQPPAEPRQPSLDIDPPDSDPDTDPAPQKPARNAGGNRLQKVDSNPGTGPVPQSSVCLSGCQRAHQACVPRCGPEPKQSSEYDAYQGCLGGCLKALSHCKMGCQ